MTTQLFTEANTEGFSTAELAILNDAVSILIASNMDAKSACDAVNNAYQPGTTADNIVRLIAKAEGRA
jgi:hypothetical protein